MTLLHISETTQKLVTFLSEGKCFDRSPLPSLCDASFFLFWYMWCALTCHWLYVARKKDCYFLNTNLRTCNIADIGVDMTVGFTMNWGFDWFDGAFFPVHWYFHLLFWAVVSAATFGNRWAYIHTLFFSSQDGSVEGLKHYHLRIFCFKLWVPFSCLIIFCNFVRLWYILFSSWSSYNCYYNDVTTSSYGSSAQDIIMQGKPPFTASSIVLGLHHKKAGPNKLFWSSKWCSWVAAWLTALYADLNVETFDLVLVLVNANFGNSYFQNFMQNMV